MRRGLTSVDLGGSTPRELHHVPRNDLLLVEDSQARLSEDQPPETVGHPKLLGVDFSVDVGAQVTVCPIEDCKARAVPGSPAKRAVPQWTKPAAGGVVEGVSAAWTARQRGEPRR